MRRNILYSSSIVGTGMLLCCLSLVGTPPVLATGDDYDDYLEQGARSLEEGEYEKACKSFEAAIRLAGDDVEEPMLGLAISYYRLERYKKTISTARELALIANEKPVRARTYNVLGLALISKKEPTEEEIEEAVMAFRQVVDLAHHEDNVSAPQYSLALALEKLGRNREASDVLQQILDKNLHSKDQLVDKARIFYCKLRETLREEPDPASSHQARLPVEEPLAREDHDEKIPSELDQQAKKEVMYIGRDVRPPEKISAPQPVFTPLARKERVQGVVIVQAIINQLGCVSNIKILKGLPMGLEEEAVKAIYGWTFRPATLDGKPVDVYYNLTVNFRLGEPAKRKKAKGKSDS